MVMEWVKGWGKKSLKILGMLIIISLLSHYAVSKPPIPITKI
jgi:hypothetical protein